MSFGKRLRELREGRSLSQLELSKILNISNSTLSLYESDKRSPDQDMLKKIADFFDVSIDYLLDRNDDPRYNFCKSDNNIKKIISLLEDLDSISDEEAEHLAFFIRNMKARRQLAILKNKKGKNNIFKNKRLD